MERPSKWPKAIFYDSKNTLFAWNPVWIKASSNIVKHYGSEIDGKEFWRIWNHFLRVENILTAFSTYREFTECLEESLVYTFKYFGIPGNRHDVKFMLDLWDEVQPFPDTLSALSKQQEITKILFYSNVETAYLEMMANKLVGFKPDFFGTMQMSNSCKPSPRAYRWVLENAGFEAKDVLYCAGVQWDVQGAIAFGMKAAWVKRGHFWGAKEKVEGVEPDYIVNDLHELTKIVESSILGR